MQSTLETTAPGAHKISGSLNADTVPAVWARIEAMDSGVGSVTVNLADLAVIDSAGLALLVQWWRLAGGSLQLYNCPNTLLALARLTDLDQVLKLSPQVAETLYSK